MKERTWLLFLRHIWIVPGFYSLAAFILAMIVIWIDISHYETVKKIVPNRLLTSTELTKTILGSIAGSLLTMTSITFSTLMVVLTTYSGQFSPRILQNFIQDKVTLRVLGVFMGGFVYSMFSLLFIREVNNDDPVISAAVGVFIAFICLAYFAHFLQHVANSIQVTKLINRLADDAVKLVEKNETSGMRVKTRPELPDTAPAMLLAENKGYLQLYEVNKLLETARRHKCVIELTLPIGSFVTKKTPLGKVYKIENGYEDIRKYIKIGDDRTIAQDLEFAIQKMSEITLRALAPGANDPNTAIDGIRHIGMALDEASRLDGKYIIYKDRETVQLIIPQRPFEEILYETLYEICYSGRDRVSVLLAVFEALEMISDGNTPSIKAKVRNFGEYVRAKVEEDILNETDRRKITERFMQL
ncbi:DUF2254 domain-containing protein [Domibacillus epiphyticus]|uniref:DUF2254 domain-containing protein n=1 Tax=Domibacillus epiphyticus TaxID=1714355 RepID=A0A1V2AAN8_9BACI|nr:DUF2254 domain-containing protein [Domibacillus epiphyticus]OMP68063.1 hypothetical protein BTO28_03685 [Domibacillus epiphyticus]